MQYISNAKKFWKFMSQTLIVKLNKIFQTRFTDYSQ